MRILPLTLALWTALSAASACLADESEKATSDDTAAFELLSSGAEPRRDVRFKPTPGALYDLDVTLAIEIENQGVESKLPKIDVGCRYAVVSVDAKGGFAVKTTIVKVSSAGQDAGDKAAPLRSAFDSMAGLEFESTFSCYGEPTSAEVDDKDYPDPTQRQMFESLRDTTRDVVYRLPDVPVGIGAKWKSARTQTAGGMKSTTSTTYEIVTLVGDRVGLTITIEGSAKKQTFQHPLGIPVDLENYEGSGKGSIVLDLASTLASTGTYTYTTNVVLSADMGMGAEPIKQRIASTVVVKSAPAKATTDTTGGGDEKDK